MSLENVCTCLAKELDRLCQDYNEDTYKFTHELFNLNQYIFLPYCRNIKLIMKLLIVVYILTLFLNQCVSMALQYSLMLVFYLYL